jgi:tRNA-dihydrouridine synthase
LALSAQKAVEFGADIIDINMGCPVEYQHLERFLQ